MERTRASEQLLLDKINNAGDIKSFKAEQLEAAASEIRDFLVDVITMNGGHLASNLGVVELTIALHRCLDMESDHIIFDVGHQSYVHKILTGRKDCLSKMGTKNGISCFPDECESKYDTFNTGHASTSISAALGIEKSMKLKGIAGNVVAIIGDGALAGGMAFEAMNNAADIQSDILIILNDNEMSISKNVGAMSRYLSGLRTRPSYLGTRLKVKHILEKLPGGGKHFTSFIRKFKRAAKSFAGQKMLFEDIGIKYLGPEDGHDLQSLEKAISKALSIKGPKLLHVITQKGKGYTKAEQDPVSYHGVKHGSGKRKDTSEPPSAMYHKTAADALYQMATQDENIVCVCPAMTEGSGLTAFAKDFPQRYFDVGICEQHALTFSAGLAQNGIKPVCVIYSSFLQRAYDQLIHDIGITGRDVVVCIDRAGVTDAYGKTHQGIYDVSFLSTVPNCTILAPASVEDIKFMLNEAIYNMKGCTAIRYPYATVKKDKEYKWDMDFGGLEPTVYNKNAKCAILCHGRTVDIALEAASDKHAVVKIRKLHPLDYDNLYDLLKDYEHVVCVEDIIHNGSVGQRLSAWLQSKDIGPKLSLINIDSESDLKGNIQDILVQNNVYAEYIKNLLESKLL